MSDEKKAGESLSEAEQQAVAIEWFFAMWDEAMKRGVSREKMAIVALSGSLNQLVHLYGEDKAATLMQQVPERILAGHFSTKNENPSH